MIHGVERLISKMHHAEIHVRDSQKLCMCHWAQVKVLQQPAFDLFWCKGEKKKLQNSLQLVFCLPNIFFILCFIRRFILQKPPWISSMDSRQKLWNIFKSGTLCVRQVSSRAGETSCCDWLGGSDYIRDSAGATTTRGRRWEFNRRWDRTGEHVTGILSPEVIWLLAGSLLLFQRGERAS